MHAHARHFQLGALGVGRAIEIKFDRAVGRMQRDAVAFENAEIGAVAQVIALPGIAVKHADDRCRPRASPSASRCRRSSPSICLVRHPPAPTPPLRSCAAVKAVVAPRRFREMYPARTSSATALRARVSGSPQPPPPAVRKVRRSPSSMRTPVAFFSFCSLPSRANKRRFVDGAGLAAVEAPGRILGALAIDVGDAGLQRPIGDFDAETAAMEARAAGIGAQREALDQKWILNLLQFDRRAAHVALADGYRGGLAVLVRTAAPAAAENIHQQKTAAVGPEAADRTAAHVALVRGRNLLRQHRRERLENGVDDGRQRDAPQPERGRRLWR